MQPSHWCVIYQIELTHARKQASTRSQNFRSHQLNGHWALIKYLYHLNYCRVCSICILTRMIKHTSVWVLVRGRVCLIERAHTHRTFYAFIKQMVISLKLFLRHMINSKPFNSIIITYIAGVTCVSACDGQRKLNDFSFWFASFLRFLPLSASDLSHLVTILDLLYHIPFPLVRWSLFFFMHSKFSAR